MECSALFVCLYDIMRYCVYDEYVMLTSSSFAKMVTHRGPTEKSPRYLQTISSTPRKYNSKATGHMRKALNRPMSVKKSDI